MNANWYGILPRWVRQKFGHVGTEMIGGIVGSEQEHHAAPYAITEEFVSVYRLHPLLPDDYEIRDHRTGELVAEIDFEPIQGHGTRADDRRARLVEPPLLVRRRPPGRDHAPQPPAGALEPRAPQRRPRRPRHDRHRSATASAASRATTTSARSCARAGSRSSRTSPTTPSWPRRSATSTTATSTASTSRSGCSPSRCRPGFGFSDTAFRIFILMASRRLKSDRFFTNDYSRGRLHARGPRLGRGHHDGRRAAAPPPGARAGARGLRERVRALAPVLA